MPQARNGNGSFSIDRIGRGSTFTESICISVFGGIQPEKLQRYLDRYETAHGQDGFIERFQIAVYPDPKRSWQLIDRRPNEQAFQRVMGLFEFLDQIPMKEDTPPAVVGYSESAQGLANEWLGKLERRLLDPELPDSQKSYLSKYRSLLPSLALIFEVAALQAIPLEIARGSVELAIEWAAILETHMDKILGVSANVDAGARTLLERIKPGEICNGLKVREIYRRNWKGLNSPAKVTKALDLLVQNGYVRRSKEGSGGHASEVIFINPSLGGAV